MSSMLRVAAAQFATGTDLGENLDTARRMLRAAADERAHLVVLPEFCNHLSIYDDAAHAWEVSLEPDGEWVRSLAKLAGELGVWVQFNVTLRRRAASAEDARPVISNSNIVVRSDGTIAAISDKTVLMGAEGDYLSPATQAPAPVRSPWGLLGSYACMDGIVPEVPRVVAANGPRLLMNSLNSFALDEASLHVPIRAAENRAWVVACCKVGPLLPPQKLSIFSEMMGVPESALQGAGESQIVAPDGTVVARGPREGEAVVSAEIDLEHPGAVRPDGTDPWANRRPQLYGALAAPTPALDEHPRVDQLLVSAIAPDENPSTTLAICQAVRSEVAAGARLIVLPELALGGGGSGTKHTPTAPDDIAAVVESLDGSDALVVTSICDEVTSPITGELVAAHVGVVLGPLGELGRQVQLHRSARHRWVGRLGDEVTPIDLAWGRLALVVGDDLIYPESTRLAALMSTDVVAMPLDALEGWETELGVVERAAENRLCVVAASRLGSAGDCVVADLPPDFTLWAPSRERDFDGTINLPDVTRDPHAVRAVIHPDRSVHRQISKGTNLVDGRPWQICTVLAEQR